jgi:hypothetical protein
MTRNTLKDPQPGDRFVLTEEAHLFPGKKCAGKIAKCYERTALEVELVVPFRAGKTIYYGYATVRLSTLAKIARPKGEK